MSIFNENTYKRLSVIDKRPLLYSDVILNYLTKLPPIQFIKLNNSNVIITKEDAPLSALIESRFARYDLILNAVKLLRYKYVIKLDTHEITVYGNKVSSIYLNHVASIISWWAKIKPQQYIITFYLTNIKKSLPPDHRLKVLTEEYMNSGFTFIKEPSDIHIFRKEESLKVLIHELIHASKFDFNNNNLIDVPVSLKDDDSSNEGITEYLAIIHYYWYIANFIDKIDPSEQFVDLLSNDLGWQYYQICKILQYFDLKLCDLLDSNNFKQRTSVISYFFLKHYFFTQNSLPIILSRNITEINKLIRNITDYIKKCDSSPVDTNGISMRMSLYELSY